MTAGMAAVGCVKSWSMSVGAATTTLATMTATTTTVTTIIEITIGTTTTADNENLERSVCPCANPAPDLPDPGPLQDQISPHPRGYLFFPPAQTGHSDLVR